MTSQEISALIQALSPLVISLIEAEAPALQSMGQALAGHVGTLMAGLVAKVTAPKA